MHLCLLGPMVCTVVCLGRNLGLRPGATSVDGRPDVCALLLVETAETMEL